MRPVEFTEIQPERTAAMENVNVDIYADYA